MNEAINTLNSLIPTSFSTILSNVNPRLDKIQKIHIAVAYIRHLQDVIKTNQYKDDKPHRQQQHQMKLDRYEQQNDEEENEEVPEEKVIKKKFNYRQNMSSFSDQLTTTTTTTGRRAGTGGLGITPTSFSLYNQRSCQLPSIHPQYQQTFNQIDPDSNTNIVPSFLKTNKKRDAEEINNNDNEYDNFLHYNCGFFRGSLQLITRLLKYRLLSNNEKTLNILCSFYDFSFDGFSECEIRLITKTKPIVISDTILINKRSLNQLIQDSLNNDTTTNIIDDINKDDIKMNSLFNNINNDNTNENVDNKSDDNDNDVISLNQTGSKVNVPTSPPLLPQTGQVMKASTSSKIKMHPCLILNRETGIYLSVHISDSLLDKQFKRNYLENSNISHDSTHMMKIDVIFNTNYNITDEKVTPMSMGLLKSPQADRNFNDSLLKTTSKGPLSLSQADSGIIPQFLRHHHNTSYYNPYSSQQQQQFQPTSSLLLTPAVFKQQQQQQHDSHNEKQPTFYLPLSKLAPYKK
jgi:hypothetical protein